MDAEVVAYLLSQKLQKLLILDESKPMKTKLKNQVQRTADQLNSLRHLMKQGEKKNIQWTNRLLHVLYSMDDAIEFFLVRKAKQQPFDSLITQVVFNRRMKEFVSKTGDLLKDKQPSNNIQDASDTDSKTPGPSRHQRWGRIISGFCFDKESQILGIDEQVKNLVAIVTQGITEQQQGNQLPAVVSVVGEGGSGKTAVARTAYNTLDVKRHFSRRAWVHVSKDFKLRDVLVDMITQLDEKVAKEPLLEDEVKWRIPKLLAQGRYLIVVDDVGTPGFWEEIKEVFPPSSHGGGVVILTTRNADHVAVPAGLTLQVRPLNDEEIWVLFLKKLNLTEDQIDNNSDLLMKSKEKIVKLCSGLPLAAVLMGGLLSAKGLIDREWSRVIENVNTIEDILASSYHELPCYLKPCFLYMGIFPKAAEIPIRRLIHLWVAEGFITTLSDGSDMFEEDLAEILFEELVCRNMAEVVRWRLDGSPKTCRLPSLVHDVFSSKARDIGLFEIHCKSFSAQKTHFPVRRLATYPNYIPCSKLCMSHLRSYVSFNALKGGIPAGNLSMFLDKIMKKKYLGVFRALDLESIYKPQLPAKAFATLLNLRYLGLRSTAITSLPDSIGLLQCLETLDVKHTNITTLPDSFWKLGNLRHLYLNGIFLDSLEMLAVESLIKLQTLTGLSIGTESLVAETFSKFTCLRKLKLTFYIPRSIKIDWTSEMPKLHSLTIKSMRESGDRSCIKFKSLKEQHNLVNLYLCGGLLLRFNSKIFPPNLKSLTLSYTGLDKDPMLELGKLPHLNVLRLLSLAYTGEEMNCASGAFPQLRVLKLWQLPDFSRWVVNEGALTCLKELEIRECRSLKRLDAFHQLTNLKELVLTNMSHEVADHVKGISNGGRDVFIKECHWEPSPPME